ncbi:unnamed protein product [Rhizophagus irregularis]|nr:unnamed protein product [Rhizophagus irregularis]
MFQTDLSLIFPTNFFQKHYTVKRNKSLQVPIWLKSSEQNLQLLGSLQRIGARNTLQFLFTDLNNYGEINIIYIINNRRKKNCEFTIERNNMSMH